MSDQARRLARVTNILGARGCAACWHWNQTTVDVGVPEMP